MKVEAAGLQKGVTKFKAQALSFAYRQVENCYKINVYVMV